MSRYTEAERDATKSLNLLPAGNTKALYRRATARKSLGKIELARQDYQAVLLEDPANQAAKVELESLPEPVKPSTRPSPPTGNNINATSPASRSQAAVNRSPPLDKVCMAQMHMDDYALNIVHVRAKAGH